ncbi:MAG: tetratricopeptide repeat protein [Anaerolineales bacterium]|nr:MAG: tetratricopeptide repeat protein [Anaerolineales bacterium]
MSDQDLLQAGIQAAKEGEFNKASAILARVVSDQPDSEEGWLWLGKALTDESRKTYCFRRVLQINPQNKEAKALLGEPLSVASKENIPNPAPSNPSDSSVHVKAGQPDSKAKVLALTSGFALAVLLCGIPLVYFVFTGRLQRVAAPFGYAAQTVAVAPVSSATVSPTPSSTPTPDISSLPYLDRLNIANPYVSEALGYYYRGEYAESIRAWDKVIEIIPEDDSSYYLRGESYLRLLVNQRSQEEYLFYLSHAGDDFDKAIELSPYDDGNYYLGRYKYYDDLSGLQPYRVDRIGLQKIALENLLLANQLGNSDPLAERYVIFSNIVVGNCDAGLQQANKLILISPEPVAALFTGLALGYMCKNDPTTALQYIDEAIATSDGCTWRLERAKIFYALGRIDEAMEDLDYTIANDPYYCGDRYYLRGLLYAETGDLQKAEEDLFFGMGQTWGRGGFLPYAQGKIALAQGETDAAIRFFQEAEATYPLEDFILTKIQSDLAALNAPTLEISSSFPSATAIPPPMPRATPRPTSSPDPSVPTTIFSPDLQLQHAWTVDIDKPVEQVALGWGYGRLWRFQPSKSLDHRAVQRLSIWLISPDTSQRLPRQLFLWNFRANTWDSSDELHWGENVISSPNDYVSPDGDVYIHFLNQDTSLKTIIDSFGITLVLQRSDGSIETHGITP